MKTCKSFFHKSLIITSADEFKNRKAHYYSYGYGFCLLSLPNHDYRAQRIYRFTDSYDVAISWLMTNARPDANDLCGVVLGSEL